MKHTWYVIVAAVVLAVSAVGLVVTTISQSIALQQQGGVIATLSANNDALREQVQSQGEIPVAPPSEQVVGAPGPIGAPGPAGPKGDPGRDGRDGRDGAEGALGSSGTPGTVGPQGPQGPAGVDGSAGEPPASWRFTYLFTTYECTRSTPFDAAAPTYTCNPA